MPELVLCIACDANYLPYAAVAARMALARASPSVSAILLCAGVTVDERERATRYVGERLRTVDATHHLEGKPLATSGHITPAAYLRLFIDLIPELEGVQRVLYMDCDVQMLADPAPLANMPLTLPAAAAYDMRNVTSAAHRRYLPMGEGSPYFNSGVVLADLPALRAEGLLEKARRFAVDHPQLCLSHDQDALNVGLEGRWQTLDWRWNAVSLYRPYLGARPFHARHFTGHKPWTPLKIGVEPRFVDDWRQALRHSPWPERFAESSLAQRVRHRTAPVADWLDATAKRLVYSGLAQSPDSNRARRAVLLSRFGKVLDRIEADAAAARPARQHPERTLLADP